MREEHKSEFGCGGQDWHDNATIDEIVSGPDDVQHVVTVTGHCLDCGDEMTVQVDLRRGTADFL